MHGKLHLPGLSLHLMSAGEPAEMARAELMSTSPSPDELLAFLGRVQSFPETLPLPASRRRLGIRRERLRWHRDWGRGRRNRMRTGG